MGANHTRWLLVAALLFFAATNAAGQEPYGYEGRFVSRGEITAAPTAVGDLAIVASADRRLYALEPGGAVRWRSELGGQAVAPVAVAGAGTLAVVTNAGELLLFDQSDGRRIWRREVPGLLGRSRAGQIGGSAGERRPTAGGQVSRGGEATSGARDESSGARDESSRAREGRPREEELRLGARESSADGSSSGANDPRPVPALITDPEGLIIVATGANELVAFSLSGTLLWRWDLPVPYSAAPIIGHHGAILVPSEEGRVTAFSRGGALLWTTFLEERATNLALTERGYLALEGGRRIRRIDSDGLLEGGFSIPPLEGFGAAAASLGVDRHGNLLILYDGGGVALLEGGGGVRWSAKGAREFTLLRDGVLLGLPGGRGELRTARGRLLWELSSEGEVRELAPLESHFLVVYGDWVMSWYRAQGVPSAADGPPSPESWRRFDGWLPERGNRQRTGGRILGSVPREGEAPLLFRELLRSPERSDRERLLSAIEERAAEGRLAGIYRGVRDITGEIALEPYIHRRGEGANDWPELRGRAARLLGAWGDLPSWRELLRLLREERELTVVISALEGLARIPYDREGEAARVLGDLERRWSRSPGYPAVAEGILDAMGALQTTPGPAAAEVYAEIARGDLPPETRNRAGRLMSTHFENRR